jgi:hypothetical protein
LGISENNVSVLILTTTTMFLEAKQDDDVRLERVALLKSLQAVIQQELTLWNRLDNNQSNSTPYNDGAFFGVPKDWPVVIRSLIDCAINVDNAEVLWTVLTVSLVALWHRNVSRYTPL